MCNSPRKFLQTLICVVAVVISPMALPTHVSHAAACSSKTDVFSVTSSGQWQYSSGGIGDYQNLNRDSARTINDLRFGDFDGDSKTDVFSVTSSGQWLYSSGGTQLYQNLNSHPGRTVNDLGFGDFDGKECKNFLPVVVT